MILDNRNKNIDTILSLLKNEIEGDVNSALEKMTEDYCMTWVYKRKDGTLFPRVTGNYVREVMKDVYVIKNRKYDIKNIVAQGDVVMAELVESYPDPKDPTVVYCTPIVIVWEFKDGKVRAGRHYCDPQLSYENLSEERVNELLL